MIAFYTMAPETVAKYQTERLALTIPFVLYGLFRYLYLIHVKHEGGSPDELVFRDKPLLATGLLWVGAVLVVLYVL